MAGDYIVRFSTYRLADDHRQSLSDSLAGEEGWTWLPRQNAAVKFPTDFGLVRLDLGRVAALLASPHPLCTFEHKICKISTVCV